MLRPKFTLLACKVQINALKQSKYIKRVQNILKYQIVNMILFYPLYPFKNLTQCLD